MVFSVEQTRCGRLPKAEPCSPALATEDCRTSDSEPLASSAQAEDAGSNPSGATELFFNLKEKPEELLQLAPEAGDAIVPRTGETDQRDILDKSLIQVISLFI